MDTVKEGFGVVLFMLVASLNILVPILLVIGLVKIWEWRREYRQLVKRVAHLEGQLSTVGAAPEQAGKSIESRRAV